MWVKICANTTLEDAARAAELGADAVGFVFATSKRQVTVAQVAAMAAALPRTVERIGIFDSKDPAEIAEAVSSAALTGVQLHGAYDEAFVERLRTVLSDETNIIQTLHWTIEHNSADTAGKLHRELDRIAAAGLVRRVLIDSKVNGASGGTGTSFDWSAARPVFSQAAQHLEVILAGGLKPENVELAIRELNPWGVDVASGVEASVGRKDPDRVSRFIQAAKLAAKG